MEARLIKIALVIGALCSLGASKASPNFVVHAPTQEMAEQLSLAAETYREEIAMEWLGHTLPQWAAPCPIHVNVGAMGAGGATTFQFDRGEVYGWHMTVQGSLERVLDSVLPHEISHTIFACHFRRPLPRWADEGAASLIEHESERYRLKRLAAQVLGTQRKIPLRKLLATMEYPQDMQNVLTLYAEGYSLADFLVQKGGKRRYLTLLDQADQVGWDKAIQAAYGYRSVDDLESNWNDWIVAGSPPISLPEGQQLVDAGTPARSGAAPGVTVRGQSPDVTAPVVSAVTLASASAEEFNLPRRETPATAPAANAAPASGWTKSLGGREAVADGWVPVSHDRRPRPTMPNQATAELTDIFTQVSTSN